MTSSANSSLTPLEDPLSEDGLSAEQIEELDARRELVRQRCAEEFSSSPLYQARAAKDPEYWNKFCAGRVR